MTLLQSASISKARSRIVKGVERVIASGSLGSVMAKKPAPDLPHIVWLKSCCRSNISHIHHPNNTGWCNIDSV